MFHKTMTEEFKKELFEFLSEHLTLKIQDFPERDYGRSYQVVEIKLMLKDPTNNEEVHLGGGTFSFNEET